MDWEPWADLSLSPPLSSASPWSLLPIPRDTVSLHPLSFASDPQPRICLISGHAGSDLPSHDSILPLPPVGDLIDRSSKIPIRGKGGGWRWGGSGQPCLLLRTLPYNLLHMYIKSNHVSPSTFRHTKAISGPAPGRGGRTIHRESSRDSATGLEDSGEVFRRDSRGCALDEHGRIYSARREQPRGTLARTPILGARRTRHVDRYSQCAEKVPVHEREGNFPLRTSLGVESLKQP